MQAPNSTKTQRFKG